MKLLLSAYDCDPVRGSEARLGWNYATELAALGHRVHVLTSNRSAQHLGPALADLDGLDISYTLIDDHPLAVRLPRIGFMGRYILWQRKALAVAEAVDKEFGCDLIHHVGWGSLQGGSHLWKLGKPFIFGPVGGGQSAPRAFRGYFGDRWSREWARTLVLVKLARFLPSVGATVRNSVAVLAANRETLTLAESLGAVKTIPYRDVAIPEELIVDSVEVRPESQPMTVVWLARFMPRKGLALALDVMAKVNRSCPVNFVVVGVDGTESSIAERVRAVNDVDADRVRFLDTVDWQTAQAELRAADLFLFTSLRDTTGVQLLEAMAAGQAVVTLDHQGGRELIDDDVGIRIPVTDPEETVEKIVATIERLAVERDELDLMRKAALRAAQTFSWKRHAQGIDQLYRELNLDGSNSAWSGNSAGAEAAFGTEPEAIGVR